MGIIVTIFIVEETESERLRMNQSPQLVGTEAEFRRLDLLQHPHTSFLNYTVSYRCTTIYLLIPYQNSLRLSPVSPRVSTTSFKIHSRHIQQSIFEEWIPIGNSKSNSKNFGIRKHFHELIY